MTRARGHAELRRAGPAQRRPGRPGSWITLGDRRAPTAGRGHGRRRAAPTAAAAPAVDPRRAPPTPTRGPASPAYLGELDPSLRLRLRARPAPAPPTTPTSPAAGGRAAGGPGWHGRGPIGCVALKPHGAPTGRGEAGVGPTVSARGLGVGRRLLAEVEAYAAEAHDVTHPAPGDEPVPDRGDHACTARPASAGVPAFNDEGYAHHWFEKGAAPRRRVRLADASCKMRNTPGRNRASRAARSGSRSRRGEDDACPTGEGGDDHDEHSHDHARVGALTAPSTIEIEERPVPTRAADEVLVRVGSVGVCGSDVHYYEHGRIGDMVVRGPAGPRPRGRRHASSRRRGRVRRPRWASGWRSSRSGRAVAAGSARPAPSTSARDMEFFATPPIDGAFCDYVALPADFAHPVPDSLSDARGRAARAALGRHLGQPEGRHVSAGVPRASSPAPGRSARWPAWRARAMGATEIVVSDPVESRRERITELAARPRRRPARGGSTRPSSRPTCSSSAPARHRPLLDGLEALRPGGTAVLVGHGDERVAAAGAGHPDPRGRAHRHLPVRRHLADRDRARGRPAGSTSTPWSPRQFALDEVEAALTSDDGPDEHEVRRRRAP